MEEGAAWFWLYYSHIPCFPLFPLFVPPIFRSYSNANRIDPFHRFQATFVIIGPGIHMPHRKPEAPNTSRLPPTHPQDCVGSQKLKRNSGSQPASLAIKENPQLTRLCEIRVMYLYFAQLQLCNAFIPPSHTPQCPQCPHQSPNFQCPFALFPPHTQQASILF